MNSLYKVLSVTKQAFHQRLDHHLHCQDEQQQLLSVVYDIRHEHPRLSARQMYFMIQPKFMGRDRFEAFCFENGFKIDRKRSFHRTTNSLGVTRFNNLIARIELTCVNQVWVSDITYYRIHEQFFYLTFVMDLYSRMIVGYSAAENLLTEHTTLPALKMAIRYRSIRPGLIFHSDGGGQYYSKQFLELTRAHQIQNSMGETVFENPNAERINGTIKNDYLAYYSPLNFEALKKSLTRAVGNYNTRPHSSHKRISPINFEQRLTS
jgi:putative transposase